MAKSETLLTVVAVTLAALVVAGLVAKTAAADHPQREIACLPKHAVVHKETPPAGKQRADQIRKKPPPDTTRPVGQRTHIRVCDLWEPPKTNWPKRPTATEVPDEFTSGDKGVPGTCRSYSANT